LPSRAGGESTPGTSIHFHVDRFDARGRAVEAHHQLFKRVLHLISKVLEFRELVRELLPARGAIALDLLGQYELDDSDDELEQSLALLREALVKPRIQLRRHAADDRPDC
jgi:hypothetical protein